MASPFATTILWCYVLFSSLTHYHLQADFELTKLFQSNLLTSSLLPNSCQLDQSGCRHWIFRGWPHRYRDWLFLWGDTARRWGDWTRRERCTGKKKNTHQSVTPIQGGPPEQINLIRKTHVNYVTKTRMNHHLNTRHFHHQRKKTV